VGRGDIEKFSVDSSDSEDRVQDFLARHGGADAAPPSGGTISPVRGWSEVYAADGYTLRCDWSRTGTKEEMTFSELPPAARERRRDKP
jgi:hypothetical protein